MTTISDCVDRNKGENSVIFFCCYCCQKKMVIVCNPLPYNTISALSKLKLFADNKSKCEYLKH